MARYGEDVYSPSLRVSPETGSPNDTLSVRASPADTGAQVGEATQGLGNTIDRVGNQAVDIAIQQQGQINETLATNADNAFAVQSGEIYGKYKSTTGLDAVNAREQAVNDIDALRQKMRGDFGQNLAAARAFDMMANRRSAYMLQDINAYSAGQQKAAFLTAKQSAASLAVDSTSRWDIASDPTKFGAELGTIKFETAALFAESGGYTSVMHQNGQTGEISFDNSDQGKMAEVAWNAFNDKNVGQAWMNRIDTLATDPVHHDVAAATRLLEANRDNIPVKAFNEIAAKLNPLFRAYQTKSTTDDQYNQATLDYNRDVSGATNQPYDSKTLSSVATFNGGLTGNQANFDRLDPKFGGPLQAMLTDYYKQTGHKALLTSGERSDLDQETLIARGLPAAPVGHSLHQQGVAADIDSNDIKRMDQLGLFQKYGLEHLSGGEYHHVQLAPGGQPQPQQGPVPTTYIPKMDWLRQNEQTYVDAARNDPRFADDPVAADAAARSTATRFDQEYHQLALQNTVDRKSIMDTIAGKYTNGQPLTDPSQFLRIPQISQTWTNYQRDNPSAAQRITKVMQSNSRGPANTWGTNFWKDFDNVVSGRVTDPISLVDEMNNDVPSKDSPLTNTGMKLLSDLMDKQGDPAETAFQQSLLGWLKSPQVRGSITGTGQVPGAITSRLDDRFEKFLMNVVPKALAAHARGVTPDQMFDPKNSEYVGGSLGNFVYTRGDAMHDLKNQPTKPYVPNPPPTKFDPTTIKTPDDLFKAAKAGNITKDQYNQIAVGHHWMQPTPEAIPTPH